MEQARWDRIEELAQAALDLRSEERTAFLRRMCAEDARLFDDVRALLSNESASALLDAPAIASLGLVPAEPALTGQRISHYRIEEHIGSGGMGEVYRARDETLRRTVALKTLPPEFTADADRVRRFEQEAFAASRLNHPNIITIFEILHCDGTHWIATEHVEGETLRAIVTDTTTKKPRSIPVERAVDIAMQVTAALEAAHAARIIHRDVKPENVMVRPDGVVKVLDFGIAKLSEEITSDTVPRAASDATSASRDLTVPGAVVGTATYMSPEQARGEPLDARTDLYSLGLVLYEMVAGERFRASAARHLDHVPRALHRILEKMLRADREERYASASELFHDLGELRRRIETASSRRLVGVSALVAFAAFALTGLSAFLSIREPWEERVLHDGHTAAVRRAIFSPDGRLLVTAGEDDRVMVWDFARRERLATWNAAMRSAALSADARWVATGGVDGTIEIRDLRTRQRIRVLQHGRGWVTALEFSPDASVLVSASLNSVILWETAGWTAVHRLPEDAVSYGMFIFAGNRRLLANTGRMMDVRSGRSWAVYPPGWNWFAVSPDGTRLTAIDTLGNVEFHRLEKAGDMSRSELVARVRAHQDHGRSVAYSPDGRLVASAADDVVLWDALRLEKIARFEYDAIVWSVTFSPDGRWLISTHGDGAVLVWNVVERRRAASLNAHGAGVRAVAFDRMARQLASAGEDHAVIVWDTGTGRKRHVLSGHETRVTAVSFATAADRLASGDQDGNVIIWDLAARRPERIIRHPTHSSYAVALSPDGGIVATTGGIYDTSDGRLRTSFIERGWRFSNIYGANFSRDGRRLAAVTEGGWVLLFDAETGRLTDSRRVPNTHLITTSMSADGTLLAIGEDEGTVRLWSVSPLREIAVLGRHAARVKSVAFAPDGATLASAGDDKMIRLWDVKRRRPRGVVGTHTSPIYSIAFSPDGRQLASGEHDRSVRVYTRRKELWGWRLD